MPKIAHSVLHSVRGMVVGAAVGEAMAASVGDNPWPTEVLGGTGELAAPWSAHTRELVGSGEAVARGETTAFDVGPIGVLGIAIADAVAGRGAPLLMDTYAAEVHGVVGEILASASRPNACRSGVVGEALTCAAALSFNAGLESAHSMGKDFGLRMALTGLFAGGRLGVTAIPTRWLTYVHGPGDRRVHYHRDLLRLADRLVGLEVRFPPDPRRGIGPVEVTDGVWAANIYRVASFCARHPDGAVISMCPMGDALDDHLVRRSFLIEDVAVRAANPRLESMVDELVASIAAFHMEGRDVLVHCHHGVSRTGLALRAWLIEQEHLSEPDATSEIEARWPWLSTANDRFTRLLEQRAARHR